MVLVCLSALFSKRGSACGRRNLRCLPVGCVSMHQHLGWTRTCSWHQRKWHQYMPPGGSQQLRHSSVTDRFQHLSHAVDDALQLGYVILGGNFNAKVADRNDVAFSNIECMILG